VIWVGAVPFVIAGLLGVSADRLGRQMRPSTAVRLLTALALSVSLCTGLVLSAAAVLLCAQWGPFPRMGGWSASTLRRGMEFPIDAGLAALIVVVSLLAAATYRAVQAVRALVVADRSMNQFTPVSGDLVIVDDDIPTAYSIGGWRGRIVVSTSMLTALSASERRVVLAHEESHLRHRHWLYVKLAAVAVAANPLLRPVVPSIKRGIERWADEDAAVSVGDRPLVARALARAALATAGRPIQPAVGLAIADDRVAERVTLLLAPAPRAKILPIAIVASAAVVSWTTAAAVSNWANNLVQLAESVYQRH
jgi:beta-lactamase regulating signal transducer with metallopeptidase domain